jgi:hypothetical protein
MLIESALATKLSGSLGGIVASHNRGGMYFRSRTTPTDPNTTLQQNIRGAIHSGSAHWKSLTDDQRKTWSVYASQTPKDNRIGVPRTLSGFNWFLGQYVRRLNAGFTPRDEAPPGGGLTPVNFLKIDAFAAANNIDIYLDGNDPWATDAGAGLIVYISEPQPVTINWFRGPYRLAATVVSSGSAPASPASRTPANTSLVAGSGLKLFYRMIVTMNDGRPSTEYLNSTFINP